MKLSRNELREKIADNLWTRAPFARLLRPYVESIAEDILKLTDSYYDGCVPKENKHENWCPNDEYGYCECGSKFFNQAIAEYKKNRKE